MSAPLVEVEGLSKWFPARAGLFGKGTPIQALSTVSFTIRPGETFGLVGESGCGKSTLGRTLLRLHEPSAGRVRIDGVEVTRLAPAALRAFRKRAQIIFQDPYGSLNPRWTIGQVLEEPLVIHHLDAAPQASARRARRRARVGELLDAVGLRRELEARHPHELSGGQRQRVGIARALAVEPKLIVADEPLSALDVSIQAQIVNLLVDLQARHQLTYLFISHDLTIVRHLCDRVSVMYLGRIVEEGPAKELWRRPLHPYSVALFSAAPEPTLRAGRGRRLLLQGDPPSPAAPPPGCTFHPRCPLYAAKGRPEVCRAELPRLLPEGAPQRAACHFPGELAAP